MTLRIWTGAILLLILAPAQVCIASNWYRYENGYFIAYSDASEKKTRSILEGLERFRVAASSAANARVPASAAKTEVLIFRSKRDYDAISPGKNTLAFALSIYGDFRIVMRASARSDKDLETVRHEYAHVLLGYHEFRYPRWYDEGFAGLVSTIRFIKDDTQFVMGEPPSGASYASGDGFDWNTLIAEGWYNETNRRQKVHDAYVQSWLLTHYVLIGDQFAHGDKLRQYLARWANGEPPLAAFEKAFGMDVNTLWRKELKSYSKRMVALVYEFRPKGMDLDFTRTVADRGLVRSLIDEVSANVIRVR